MGDAMIWAKWIGRKLHKRKPIWEPKEKKWANDLLVTILEARQTNLSNRDRSHVLNLMSVSNSKDDFTQSGSMIAAVVRAILEAEHDARRRS